MRILPVIIILIGIICFAFIFDYRQKDIYEKENENDYNYNLDVEIPNKSLLPIQDIFNNFSLYNNDKYINGFAYKLLSDSDLKTRLIGKNGNYSYIFKLSFNNEIGNLLGCFIIYSSSKSNNSKTILVSLLKENKTVILFQESNNFKELKNEFSESYLILNNTEIKNEIIKIETFIENIQDSIQIYEIYLLIISNNDLFPKVEIEKLELIFLFNIDFYYFYERIIKIILFIIFSMFYIHFYIGENKKIKQFFNKYQ